MGENLGEQSQGTGRRVLVIDDDEVTTTVIGMALRYDGWTVQTGRNAEEGIAALDAFDPTVVLASTKLSDMTALELLTRIRSMGSMVPMLFITDDDTPADRMNGLTAGGDDCIEKPFSSEALLGSMRALMRRAQAMRGEPVDPLITLGDLVLNEDTWEVERAGEQINLSATEFELLRYLLRNQNRVLSKAQIIGNVWPYGFSGKSSVTELYISYLRKKLDEGREPMIHTVRGAGYRIKAA